MLVVVFLLRCLPLLYCCRCCSMWCSCGKLMTLSATGVCVYEQQQQHCEIVLTLSWATLVLVSSTTSSSCTAADKAEMCSMYWRCHFYLTRILFLLLPMLVSHSTQLAKHTHTHSLQCSVLTEADTLPSDSTLADPVCVCVMSTELMLLLFGDDWQWQQIGGAQNR